MKGYLIVFSANKIKKDKAKPDNRQKTKLIVKQDIFILTQQRKQIFEVSNYYQFISYELQVL